MDPLMFNVVLLSPLFLGFILSQFLRLNLRMLQGVYLLLAAGNIALSYFLLQDWITPAIIAAIGFITLVIAAGLLGGKVRPSDYVFMQVGVGLFPWVHWGLLPAIAYGVSLAGFATLVALRPKFKNPLKRGRS